jgi:hypothetical protein
MSLFGLCLRGGAVEVRLAWTQDTHNPKPYIAGVPS